MPLLPKPPRRFWILIPAIILAAATPHLAAQCLRPYRSAPGCEAPCLPPATTEPRPTEPPTEPRTTPEPTQPTTTPERPDVEGFRPPAGPGETVAVNMMGNLLGAGQSVAFFYQRSQGSVFINGTGSTNIVNAKVADNNSPVPADRLSFRFNYFAHSLAVTGDSGQAFFDPSLGLSQFSGPRFRGVTTTKKYDVEDYTFTGEKTFLDKQMSVELRVPFGHTLSHNLNLSVADISSRGRDNDGDSDASILQTVPTPGKTLGSDDTEFGNMTLILKGVLYQTDRFLVSGGASLGIPTAQDNRVRVIDYLGDVSDNDVEIQRERLFHIHNDTWALSPFLAFLAVPNDRFFVQGFMQVDFPLNKSRIDYFEGPLINTEPAELQFGSLTATDHIREQTLLQTDIGTGFWLVRNRGDSWLTGVAPTLELHYTTTLNNADVRSLPNAIRSSNLQVVGPNGTPIPEPSPQVGNLRNRVDLLDMTVGTTFEFNNRTTLAAGFAFPLRSGDNRTFDWEFLLQLNVYFGARGLRAPTFQ
jgi:hypothetical protein